MGTTKEIRKSGYYWVLYCGYWVIATYRNDDDKLQDWYFDGGVYLDTDFEQINESIIIEPKETTQFEKAIKETIEEPIKFKHLPNIVWQLEEWIEKAESIARITGIDDAGNKYEGSALMNGSLIDGTSGIEKILEYELVKEKPTRPDLTFITKHSFDNHEKYVNWYIHLTSEQKNIMRKFEFKMPEFIMIAEMFYDIQLSNQDSPIFRLLAETLNTGK